MKQSDPSPSPVLVPVPVPNQDSSSSLNLTSTQNPNFDFQVLDTSLVSENKKPKEKEKEKEKDNAHEKKISEDANNFHNQYDNDIDAMPEREYQHQQQQQQQTALLRPNSLIQSDQQNTKKHPRLRGWPDGPDGTFSCTVHDCSNRGVIWTSEESLRGHMNLHAQKGDIPDNYLKAFSRTVCHRCRFTVSISHARNGMHKQCAKENIAPQIDAPIPQANNSNLVSESIHQLLTHPNTNTNTNPNTIVGARSINIINDHWSLPTPEAIAICPARLLPRIPKTLRAEFAGCVSKCLQDLVRENNGKSWSRWSMLTRVLLWKKDRGGKQYINRITSQLKERLSRWHKNDFKSLWSDFLEHSKSVQEVISRPAKPRSPESNRNSCKMFLSLGEGSKAIQSLHSNGVCTYDQKTIDALQQKHPFEEEIKVAPSVLVAHNVKPFSKDDIMEYIKKLRRSSSGGNDLFCSQYLLDLVPYEVESSAILWWIQVAQIDCRRYSMRRRSSHQLNWCSINCNSKA